MFDKKEPSAVAVLWAKWEGMVGVEGNELWAGTWYLDYAMNGRREWERPRTTEGWALQKLIEFPLSRT